jgi:hypothetical protein
MSVNQQQFKENQTAQEPNRQTFRDLHGKYRDRLLHSMTTVVKDRDRAEDITAEAFAVAFEKLGSFRAESSFYTWLHTIALNEAKNGWRRKQTVSIESLAGPEPEALIECDVLADKLDHNACSLKLRKGSARYPGDLPAGAGRSLRPRILDQADRRARADPGRHGSEPDIQQLFRQARQPNLRSSSAVTFPHLVGPTGLW